VSATERFVVLEKAREKIHDEVWRLWFRGCLDRLMLTSGTPGSLEERLFAAIARTAQNLGDDWPIVFRNAVNYRPGFAYTAVRRDYLLKSLSYLKSPATYDVEELIGRFERAVVQARNPAVLTNSPQLILEILVDMTFLIHAVVSELLRELVDRHSLDRRWLGCRQHFLRTKGLVAPEGCWPI
jgi:hypothetical protein